MSPLAKPTVPPTHTTRTLRALAERRSLSMLALGFSAGLPAVLIFDTLSVWLRDSGVSLETIAFLSLVTLVYSIKFVWAPMIDRVALPLLTRSLGRRRSWMLTCQTLIVLGLWLLSAIDPAARIGGAAALALFVAVASATQDLAMDAWRIEVGGTTRLGVMAAAYQWGYRIAMLVAGAVPLILAEPFGWNVSYATMAALMGIGVAAVLVAPAEEPGEDLATAKRQRGVFGRVATAFAEPLGEFFRRHGAHAVPALALVCTYRLPDLVPSTIGGPFFLDLGFTLVEIAEVRRVWGIGMTIVGVGAGGLAVARFGLWRALVAGVLCGTAGRLALVWLSTQGRDMGALIVTTALDQAAAGFAGTCLIAYMSSLTTGGSTATQYALLSSLFVLPGRLLASQSGRIVEVAAHAVAAGGVLRPLAALFSRLPPGSYPLTANPAALGTGYLVFFVYSALLGLIPLALTVWVARRARSTLSAR